MHGDTVSLKTQRTQRRESIARVTKRRGPILRVTIRPRGLVVIYAFIQPVSLFMPFVPTVR